VPSIAKQLTKVKYYLLIIALNLTRQACQSLAINKTNATARTIPTVINLIMIMQSVINI